MKLRYKALDWSVRVKKKSGRETHSGHFLGSSLGTGNALFCVSTSFRILTITCSFRIRFE